MQLPQLTKGERKGSPTSAAPKISPEKHSSILPTHDANGWRRENVDGPDDCRFNPSKQHTRQHQSSDVTRSVRGRSTGVFTRHYTVYLQSICESVCPSPSAVVYCIKQTDRFHNQADSLNILVSETNRHGHEGRPLTDRWDLKQRRA